MTLAIVDHPGVVKVHNATISVPTQIIPHIGKLLAVIWNGGTTSGHKASLTDKDGYIKWQADLRCVTEGGLMIRDWAVNIGFDELWCDDLDSGDLLIYWEMKR